MSEKLTAEQWEIKRRYEASVAEGEIYQRHLQNLEKTQDATPAPSATAPAKTAPAPGAKDLQTLRKEFLDRYSTPAPLPKVGGLPNAIELEIKPGSPEHAALKRAYLEKYV